MSTLLSQIRVPELGDYRITVLAEHGITTLEELRATSEETLAGLPRFGKDAAVRILASANRPGPFSRRVMVARPAAEPAEVSASEAAAEAPSAPPAPAAAKGRRARPASTPTDAPAAADAASTAESAPVDAAALAADPAPAARPRSRLVRMAAAAAAAASEKAAARAKSQEKSKAKDQPKAPRAVNLDSDGASAVLKRGPGRPPKAHVTDADPSLGAPAILGDAEGDASGPALSAAPVEAPALTEVEALPALEKAPRKPRASAPRAAAAAPAAAPAPTPVEETAAADRDFVARTALDEAISALRQVRAHLKSASQAGPVRKARKAVKKLRATLVVLRSAVSKTGVDDKGLARLQAVLQPVREQVAEVLSGTVSVPAARALRNVARTAREVLED